MSRKYADATHSTPSTPATRIAFVPDNLSLQADADAFIDYRRLSRLIAPDPAEMACLQGPAA